MLGCFGATVPNRRVAAPANALSRFFCGAWLPVLGWASCAHVPWVFGFRLRLCMCLVDGSRACS
eukprot:140580-Alexandrium_andersonii.AAC.1